MAERVRKFKEQIRQGEQGALGAFEAFQNAARKYAASVRRSAGEVFTWSQRVEEEFLKEDRVRNEKFALRCKELVPRSRQRIISLGYDTCDFRGYMLQYCLLPKLGVRRFTRRVRRQIHYSIEGDVIERERHRVRSERVEAITIAQEGYLKSLTPKLWRNQPTLDDVLKFGAFKALLDATVKVQMSSSELNIAIGRLPDYFDLWQEQQRRRLISLLPHVVDNGVCLPLHHHAWTALYLATLDDIELHFQCHDFRNQLHISFNSAGSRLVELLVQSLDLDPSTTTVAYMDQLNARFVCAECPNPPSPYQVMTWKELVLHGVGGGHSTPAWHLLSPEAHAIVRHHELLYPSATDKAWSCTHCSAHFRNYVTRQQAVHHVKSVHSIICPVADTDFFYDRSLRAEHTPNIPVTISSNPAAEYRCKRCPHTRICLFAMRALKLHLVDKHGIREPQLDIDFVKVQLFQNPR